MKIPYGKTMIDINLDVASVESILPNVHVQSPLSEDQIVLDAMASPINSPTLQSLAEGKRDAVIIISDHTRPVPSKYMIPHMLKELRDGNPDIEIKLLVATGCHRGTTKYELINKLGEKIVENEEIIIHDCLLEEEMIDMGELPSGARLIINEAAINTDLLIAEGFIEPHFFAGFSGGRKSVLPGVCSRNTVLGNHCSQFIESEYARAGILENNPIQTDMLAACKMVNLQYILNVIINSEKQIVSAYAGNPFVAHEKGCEELLKSCCVTPEKKGDIVIVSNGGAPLDQNVYQAVKGLSTAEAAAEEGAVLIICAECADGIGGDDFYDSLSGCISAEELFERVLKVPMNQTRPDQWQYQILARILIKHHVIFVTRPELKEVIQDMKMEYAADIDQALEKAWEIKGKECHHVVIPDGISVIITEHN